jgi:hypothetical protein
MIFQHSPFGPLQNCKTYLDWYIHIYLKEKSLSMNPINDLSLKIDTHIDRVEIQTDFLKDVISKTPSSRGFIE